MEKIDEKFNLVEIELDDIETLEDTIAPVFGIACKGCVSSSAFGIWCG